MDDKIRAIRQALIEQPRFQAALGCRQLEISGSNRYPRFSGDADGEHHAILVKYTGDLNARRFMFWLTAAPKELDAAKNPPDGFHYWLAQVGQLPDGNPWWIALYDLPLLFKADAIEGELIERVSMGNAGTFYRVDPARLPEWAQPTMFDMQTITMDAFLEEPSTVDERVELAATLKAFKPGETVTLRGTVVKHNGGNTTILFPGLNGGVKWAVVDSVVVSDVS